MTFCPYFGCFPNGCGCSPFVGQVENSVILGLQDDWNVLNKLRVVLIGVDDVGCSVPYCGQVVVVVKLHIKGVRNGSPTLIEDSFDR